MIFRFLIKNKNICNPCDCILNAFTLYVALLVFLLLPNLKQLFVL